MTGKPPSGLSKWGRRDWHQKQRWRVYYRRKQRRRRERDRRLMSLTAGEFEGILSQGVHASAVDLAQVVEHTRRKADLVKIFKFLKRLRRK